MLTVRPEQKKTKKPFFFTLQWRGALKAGNAGRCHTFLFVDVGTRKKVAGTPLSLPQAGDARGSRQGGREEEEEKRKKDNGSKEAKAVAVQSRERSAPRADSAHKQTAR